MNIVMLTNTYLPHVGGVARSVSAFSDEYRKRGHRVLIVAPEFPDKVPDEQDVVRIHAIQNFNGSDFSVALPFSGDLSERLDEFSPDIVHSHHPFLLGMSALRVARERELPLVFTHHTLYERYTHYVPADSQALKRFVIELATRYANLASQVFAPSQSIAELLRERGVKSPIAEVPTGVQLEQFAGGEGTKMRSRLGIPESAFVIGHLGRLAREKNLEFLATATAEFMALHADAHFLLVGSGPLAEQLKVLFASRGLAERLHMPGTLLGDDQRDAYSAMDAFVFASTSETQGMVLSEAMAAGVPVIALDANGTREVVCDGANGRLVMREELGDFVAATEWLYGRSAEQRQALSKAALSTAQDFSMENCAQRALDLYAPLLTQHWPLDDSLYAQWSRLRNLIGAQWEILEGVTGAAGAALTNSPQR
ncbi:Glycosyltransferase involved in cell wall bisynthesis [Microbulbifer donghaiensis]|uniref:Glycosyltransferase involved in cell wall bisynthesis n=1 Tax=Microbulbifer donghaiensis TaxID=494016 RepID=A0A1M4VAQ0_9GAMM|nr:glycosyltransferase [Microbulbifer donghaiensis]SHE66051.1 Glycosyltransferase involved in cell wall bisynthesis [Microbulbifer donghaiensis]